MAPSLGRVPTKLLAMVVADISNPLFVDVFRGAEVAAQEAGYTLLLFDTREEEARERAVTETFLEFVEGLSSAKPAGCPAPASRSGEATAVVVLTRAVNGLPSILTDGARGVRRVAEHLGELGHDAVTYIGGPGGVLGRRRALARAGGGG